jgi:hypothetical protein
MAMSQTPHSAPLRKTTGQLNKVAADATPRMRQNWTFVADKIIERERVSSDGNQTQLPSPGKSSAAAKDYWASDGVPMFGWFKSERHERRKKVKQDRKHLEERARRFLKSYLGNL